MKHVIKGLSIVGKIVIYATMLRMMIAMIGLGYDEAHRTHESMNDVSGEEMFRIGQSLGQRSHDGWKWAFNL